MLLGYRRKIADLKQTGDMSAIEESTKLASEAASLAQEMEGKYKDAADYQKFTDAYLKEMSNCK